MDSIVVPCTCGARVKMPASLAGKQVHCPKCSEILSVPGHSSPAPAAPAPSAAPATKDCIYCGETILASARKCKHCGEFLEEEREPAVSTPAPSRGRLAPASASSKKAAPTSDDDPGPAEYFAAILLAPIGLLIGAVWAARKLPKAKKMLQVAGAMTLIDGVGAYLAWKYFLSEPDLNGMAVVSDETLKRPQVIIIPGDGSEEGPPQGGRRGGGPVNMGEPEAVDLDGYPPIIQKAMKANVLIRTEEGLGSGVVLQREGDDIWILTNHHVIDNTFARSHGEKDTPLKDIPKPTIYYFDKTKTSGQVLWVAPDGIDLAVVKASAPRVIEPIDWQAMPRVHAGQDVFAVGNPMGLNWTYTKGVISATRKERFPRNNPTRDVPLLQTDTSITHGNSGGGLYNTEGQLVGINSFIMSGNAASGLGFAIRPSILLELKPEGIKLPEGGATK